MESTNIIHLVFLILLLVNIIDARHLTDIESDAATRTSKSLVAGGVSFLGKPTRDSSVKVARVEDVKRTNQSQEDGSFRTLDSVNQKDKQHSHVSNITELKEVHSNVKEQHVEEKESSQDNVMVQGNSRNDFSSVDTQDKFTENRSSENGLDPNKFNLTTANVWNNEPEHIVEHPETSGSYTDEITIDVDTVSTLAEYDETEIDTNMKHSIDQNILQHTRIASADSVIHSTNEKMLTNGNHKESDNTAVNHDLSDQKEIESNNHAVDTHHSENTHTETMAYPLETLQSTQQTHTEDDASDLAHARQSQIKDIHTIPQWKTPPEADTHDSIERNNAETDSLKGDVTVKDHHSDIIKPKVTVFVEEKNVINGHTQRIIASNGEGIVQSRIEHDPSSNLVKAQVEVDGLQTNEETHTPAATVTSRLESTTEVNNANVNRDGSTGVTPTERKTPQTERTPQDVEPLDIFTNDIKYQRFPRPMSYTTLKNKVLDKPLKKLYILEETKKKLFQHVRQLEAVYTVEDGVLYVSFLFRFVFSRKCQEIKKFKLGNLVGNTDLAMFEKELKDGRTERIMFFSERPEDYVFFMSCTDMKNSPFACRDSYYVTLDSAHDPPNQFPWGDAARELESKMDLTFEDPRFIFNFVLLPCARSRASV